MGEMNYKCQTSNMKKCVENLIKWINSAYEMEELIGIDAWEYLSGGVPGWSFTIDGVDYNLEDALDTLWCKASDNLDSVSNNERFFMQESKVIGREQCLQEAFSACANKRLNSVVDALTQFLQES